MKQINNESIVDDNDSIFAPNLNKKLIMTDITDALYRDNETEVSHMFVYKSKTQDILDKFFS